MPRTGYAHLPLRGGKAPRWLFERMVRLSREIILFVVSEFGAPEVLRRLANLEMPRRHLVSSSDIKPKYLDTILVRTYEAAPRDFESLLSIEGVGPKTLRALALTSELIYGTAASRMDPARYSFAHGGKDGTPFPVDRPTYDKTIEVMHHALNGAKIDRSEKVRAFRRLAEFSRADHGSDGSRGHAPPALFNGRDDG